MATLDSFLPARNVSLESFRVEGPLMPIANTQTNKNIAAHTAALSGDPESVEATYLQVADDLDRTGQSEMGEALQNRAKEFSYQQERNALVEILSDPEISDEQKQEAANQFLDRTNENFANNYTLSKIVAETSLTEPSGMESAEAEDVRVSFASAIDEVEDYRKWQEALINQEAAARDPNLAETIGDVLEIVVPFAEGAQVGRIRRQVEDGNLLQALKDTVAFGWAKADIRDKLRALPPEQRRVLAQGVVDIVNSEAGILLSDENELARMHQIRSFLEEGYYETEDMLLDSLIGVLDLTLFASPVGRLLRGARRADAPRPLEGDFIPGQPRGPDTPSGQVEVDPISGEVARPRVEGPEAARAEEGPRALSQDSAPRLSPPSETDIKIGRVVEEASPLSFMDESRLFAMGDEGGSPWIAPDGRVIRTPQDHIEFSEAMGFSAYTDTLYGTGAIRAMFSKDPAFVMVHAGPDLTPEQIGVIERYARENNAKILYGRVGRDAPEFELPSMEELTVEEFLERVGRRLSPEEMAKRRIETAVRPSTLSQTYRSTNPKKARAAHEAAAKDASGEAAEALYGTSRTEAVAHDLVGQIGSQSGRVKAKVSRADADHIANITPNREIMDIVRADGGLHYWRQEKEFFDSRVTRDFHNAFGVTARPEMFQYYRDGVNAKVRAVYGPMDSGWSNAQDALELTAFNLRHYGVTEDQLTLLMRQGDDYVPISPDRVPEGSTDFLVQVDADVRMSAAQMETWEPADVLHNWFDRFSMLAGESQGSFQRHLLDAHSMLHPNITLGANVAVDKANALEKALLNTLKPFTDKYTKLPKDRQQILESIIKEANYNSRVPNTTELMAQGLTRDEIQALRDWKEFWDTQWWLENRDLKRTLSNRGYMMLENPASETRVFARPVSQNRAPQHARVFDDNTGEIISLTREDIQELYRQGGTLAEMRQPLRVGDEVAELVISREAPGSSYLRAFNEDDAVLNYREGYYQVFYDAPRFIDEIVRDSRGDELYRRAVATAGNTRDADLMVRRMESTTGKVGDFVQREGREKMNMGGDDYWNIQLASGRSAQRVRGERLESATSVNNTAIDHNFVLEPGEAAVAAIRSVARRVRMRDYLEATKSRFMDQYADMLPKDQYDRPQYPGRISDIKKKEGTQRDKDIADARTTYEYIQSLENGYINMIDQGYKALMRGVADIAGRKGHAKTEEAFHYLADSRGPMQLGRNTAFTLYLALNPLRQAIVQGHQAVQLAANFGPYVATRLAGDTALIMQMKTSELIKGKMVPEISMLKGTGRDANEAVFMAEQFERSGLSASIDKQNLVRGSLTEYVEYSSYTGSVVGKALKPIEWSRKIGFDAGENINMLTSWLAHYDRRLKDTGKRWDQLNQEDLDWISAKARSYTYNMNLAGEMPYNANWMGMQMQFMQVPHKAFLQMFFDRTLTRMEKARLVAFNTVMYGVPASSIMYPWMEASLPEEGELREMVLQGLEAYTFNKMLSLATGEETILDYSGLAAADMTALWDLMAAMVTTDAGTILAESPSGSLFFGGNPRMTNFFKTVARYGNFVDDVQDPVTMQRIAKDMASLSSGMSNYFKARYVMKTGQKINSTGDVVVDDAGVGVALGALFGFPTREEMNRYYLNQAAYEGTQEFREDVRTYWREVNRHLTAEGVDKGSQEWNQRVVQDMQRVWGDSPAAKSIILNEMQGALTSGDDKLFRSILQLEPYMDNADIRHLARTMPNEELRQEMLRILDFWDSYDQEPFEE